VPPECVGFESEGVLLLLQGMGLPFGGVSMGRHLCTSVELEPGCATGFISGERRREGSPGLSAYLRLRGMDLVRACAFLLVGGVVSVVGGVGRTRHEAELLGSSNVVDTLQTAASKRDCLWLPALVDMNALVVHLFC